MALHTHQQYAATVTPVGNSMGIRIPKAFFSEHPEFKDKVSLTVVGDGQVLLSASPGTKRKSTSEEVDPVLASFFQFVEKQMIEHPELIEPVDAAQLQRIAKLIDGVE